MSVAQRYSVPPFMPPHGMAPPMYVDEVFSSGPYGRYMSYNTSSYGAPGFSGIYGGYSYGRGYGGYMGDIGMGGGMGMGMGMTSGMGMTNGMGMSGMGSGIGSGMGSGLGSGMVGVRPDMNAAYNGYSGGYDSSSSHASHASHASHSSHAAQPHVPSESFRRLSGKYTGRNKLRRSCTFF